MKTRVFILSVIALLLVQIPSHDQDQWSAAVDKARNIADVLQASYYKALNQDDLVYASIRPLSPSGVPSAARRGGRARGG